MNTINTIKLFTHPLLKPGCLLLLILSLNSPDLSAAEINVAVDRNPVSIDESFQITFSTTESPDGEPDFSPIEQSFSILSRSLSNNASLINGKASHTINWILTVQAHNAGNQIIPAIQFGNDSSKPLAIVVSQAKVNNDVNTNADIFMEVEAKPLEPYIQSQVIYTLRLFRKVDIAQAQLTEPELADAVVEKLGEDSNYNSQVKGVTYSVTERKYAIYPQKSGKMTIKPLTLTAEIVTGVSPAFNSFFNSQTTQSKRILSKEINLNVKPKPATYTYSHWLPADQLVLKQEWSGDFEQMKVGEPLTRTLTVQAMGITVSSIPELNTTKTNDQLKIYPDQPVLKEQKTTDGLIASREEKIAIIPSKAGNYTLPAIEIPWFNTQKQKLEIAKIPEITLKATGIPGIQTAPVAAPVTTVQNPQQTAITQPVLTQTPEQKPDQFWLWTSVFLAFGWLATVIFFLKRRTPATKPVLEDNQAELDMKHTINNLKKACADNNAASAKNALLVWGKMQHSATTLAAIAAYCDSELKHEILALNQVLYGKDVDSWQGQKLFQAFMENKSSSKKTASKEDNSLEPLYRL